MAWQVTSIEEFFRNLDASIQRMEALEERYLVGVGGFVGRLAESVRELAAQYHETQDAYLQKRIVLAFSEIATHLAQVLIGYGCYQDAQEVANLAFECSLLVHDREHIEEAWLLYLKASTYQLPDEEFVLEKIRSTANRLLHRSGGDLTALKPSQRRNQAHLMQQTAQFLWRAFKYREQTVMESGEQAKLTSFYDNNLVSAWNMKLLNPESRSQREFRRRIITEMPASIERYLETGLLYRSLKDWIPDEQCLATIRLPQTDLDLKVQAVSRIAEDQSAVIQRRYPKVFKVKTPYRKGLRLSDEVAELVNRGRKAFLDEDLATATEIFTQLFNQNPTQPFLKEWYALMRGEAGDWGNADRLLTQVINVRQANFITFWNLAYFKFCQGLKTECLDLIALDHWLKLNLNRDEYSTVVLGLALELQEVDLALKVLESPTLISYLPLAVKLAQEAGQTMAVRKFLHDIDRELQPESWYDNEQVPLEDERRVQPERLKIAFSYFVSNGLEDAGIRYFKNRLHYEPHYYANWGFLGSLYENLGSIDRAFKAYARKAECTLHSKTRYAIKQQVYLDLLNFCTRHRRDDLLEKALQWADRAGLDPETLNKYRRIERRETWTERPREQQGYRPHYGAYEPRPEPQTPVGPRIELDVLTPFIAAETDVTSIVIRFRNLGIALPKFKAMLASVREGWEPLHHEPFQIPYLPREATTVYRFPVRKGQSVGNPEFKILMFAEPEPKRAWESSQFIRVPLKAYASLSPDLRLPNLFPPENSNLLPSLHSGLITEMTAALADAPVVIVAPNGTGKSGLLDEIQRTTGKQYAVFQVKTQGEDQEFDPIQAALDLVWRFLTDRNITLDSDMNWLLPSRRLLELIRYIRTVLQEHVLILWDDALLVSPSSETVTRGAAGDPLSQRLDFLEDLARIVENHVVITMSPTQLSQIVTSHQFFSNARKIRLQFLSEKKANQLLVNLSRAAGLVLPEETIERFWRLTHGYLSFMRGLAEELTTQILKRELRLVIAPQDVDRAGNLMIDKAYWFQDRWQPQTLTGEELAVCRSVLELQRRPGTGIALDVLNDQLKFPEPKLQHVLEALTHKYRLLTLIPERNLVTLNGILLDWYLEQDRATFHLGEQRTQPTGICVESGAKCALFVDHENLYLSLRDQGLLEDNTREPKWLLWVARKLRRKAEELGPLAVQPVVVANWDRPPFRYHMRSYRNAGYDIRIPATNKNRSADFELYDEIHSVLTQHPEVGRFIVVSSDRDFAQVALRLRNRYNKKVEVWAVAGPAVSENYREVMGDDIHFLNDLLLPHNNIDGTAYRDYR